VRHLPHQLVDAFKSTLEEVTGADLIVHVVDGAHPDPFEQIRAIENSLPHPNIEIDTVIPYTRGDLVNAIHEKGEVLEEEFRPEGTYLRALVDDRLAKRVNGVSNRE